VKVGNPMSDKNLSEFMKRLIPISDFSKGKTAKIFDDLKKTNHEYVILKNNQPAAVLLSVNEYEKIIKKANQMELLLETIEEYRIFKEAEIINKKLNSNNTLSFESVLKELNISKDEINELVDSVDIE